MAELTYAEAARQAVAEEMRRDPKVWCLGEDLQRGGVFGQYKGLVDEFGPARIADAPISEAAIMGVATGAAMTGARPIAELRFADFALCAIDELVNQAAKARYMFGGQTRVPLVVREPSGIWKSAAAQHSQMLESWYAHIPGLVVVCPGTPADNKALLKAAIRCDDPVVYLEHKNLWQLTGEVPDDLEPGELGTARVAREGDHLTLVTWSAVLHESLRAAEQLARQGLSVEVIDLRTIWPWDREAVFASVRKTGRLLVAHEAVQVAGFGAEIVAEVSEHLFADLKAPPKRLAGARVPVPYSPPLEQEVKVTAEKIVEVGRTLTR